MFLPSQGHAKLFAAVPDGGPTDDDADGDAKPVVEMTLGA